MFKKSLVLVCMLIGSTALANPPPEIHIAEMEGIVEGARIVTDHEGHSWKLDSYGLTVYGEVRTTDVGPDEAIPAGLTARIAAAKAHNPNSNFYIHPLPEHPLIEKVLYQFPPFDWSGMSYWIRFSMVHP